MQRHHVTLAQQALERGAFDAGDVLRVWVEHQDADVEPAQPPQHGTTDRAAPDQPDGGAVELPPDRGSGPRPCAGAHRAVVLRHPPQRREHQRDRVIGTAPGVRAGGRADDHAAASRRLEIDRIRAHADARDDPQPIRGVQHRRVEAIRGHDRRLHTLQ
jgi:hypothetical protein